MQVNLANVCEGALVKSQGAERLQIIGSGKLKAIEPSFLPGESLRYTNAFPSLPYLRVGIVSSLRDTVYSKSNLFLPGEPLRCINPSFTTKRFLTCSHYAGLPVSYKSVY